MIPVKTIETKADQIIAGTPTAAELAQLVAVGDYLDDVTVLTAATLSALPSAVNNRGIIYYVTSAQKYYFSDGFEWRADFTSAPGNIRPIVYGWGNNGYGRLGDGTITSRQSPVTVVGGIVGWSQVSAGDTHSLGVTSSGIAYAWGRNYFGRLGDSTTSDRSSPVTIVGGITNWSQAAAGKYHSLGLTSSGIVYAWGANFTGVLGDNTTVSKSSPVTVVGGIINWTSIAGGEYHSLGLTATGIAYAWGQGTNGRLGDNLAVNRSSPVVVVGGITNWSQLDGGGAHSLGLTSTGITYAWGLNTSGQLGDNTTSARSSPVTVVGGITNWSQLSGLFNHNLGVTTTGVIYGWGSNSYGQVGDNTSTTSSRSSPVTVVGGITNWSSVAAGKTHSLGLTSSGIIYGWGNNGFGRLGDNTTISKLSPVTVVGGITNWLQIAAGGFHSLGITNTTTKGFL